MRFAITLVAMLGCLGCGDDDGVVPIADGGVDAGSAPVDGGPPPVDAGPDELVPCDLRDPDPCPGDAECVGYSEQQADFAENPDHIRTSFVCREGLRIAEGLPCSNQWLPDRGDGWMRWIDNCTEGTVCGDAGGFDLYCRRWCGPDLATCDPGMQCVSTLGLGERMAACNEDENLTGCDPVLQTGCAAGEGCWLARDAFDLGAGVGFCYPLAGLPPHYDHEVRLGRGCESLECNFGQACVEQGGEWNCQKLCDTTGIGVPGTTIAPPADAPWGTCPASAPTCVPMFPGLPTPAGYCD